MTFIIKAGLSHVAQLFLYSLTLILCGIIPKRRKCFVFGTTPIKSNAYWARALRESGLQSVTLMSTHYSINSRGDFDLYFEDFAPAWVPQKMRHVLGRCGALLYVFRNAAVVHQPFSGFVLAETALWCVEAWLLRKSGIKVVVIPYGWDAYMSSRIMDTSLRHALLLSYPKTAQREYVVRRHVQYWTLHADCVICGFMIDGMGRWDLAIPCPFVIDIKEWTGKHSYSDNDGTNGPVKVIHTPNHRGFKGTEFLMAAIAVLQREGLRVELDLLEKVPNTMVRGRMVAADILAEQFIFTGYALSGIEGMACGLPVMANLENGDYTSLYRRYSFLNECPVVSTTPERLTDDLRTLVTKPELRKTLGEYGRKYVVKYHSYEACSRMFEQIYERILYGHDIDLMGLYHPMRSHNPDLLQPPLHENRLFS